MTTLAKARLLLAKYADNGVCSSDPRVTLRINEAQRRLYAVRSWIGVMAKAICAVTETEVNGAVQKAFIVPQGDSAKEGADRFIDFGFNSISRVSEYEPTPAEATSSQTVYPYIKTNSVQAFVNESYGVLQVYPDPANPYRYVLVSPKEAPGYTETKDITHVEVTGQLKFKPATLDTDILLIDDLDALKLMMLALWREENNQMDLAKTLEAKAIEHLSGKTDSSIELARKISYQSSINNYPYGTMGFVRSRLALDLKNGLRLDDAELIDLINKATDILVTKYNFLIRNGRYGVKDNLPSLTNEFSYNDERLLPIRDYSIIKMGVLSVEATNGSKPDIAEAFIAQAMKEIERQLALDVETKRHTVYQNSLESFPIGTLGYTKAKIALDLPNGLRFSDKELTEMVNKAQEKLISHYNSLLKTGRYGVKDALANLTYSFLSSNSGILAVKDYDAIRYEVMSNLALVSGDPDSSTKSEALTNQAFLKLEKELQTRLETKRHLEYKSALEGADEGTYLQIKAKLALELEDGLKASDSEIEQGIKKAIEKLINQYNSLIVSGRLGVKSNLPKLNQAVTVYDSGLPPEPLRDYDTIKYAYLSIGALNRGQIEQAKILENEAFQILEKDVADELEVKRHTTYQALLDNSARGTYGWAKARLALELPNGIKLSDKELTDLVLKAQEKLISHYNFLIKAGRLGVKRPLDLIEIASTPPDSSNLPISDYEAIKAAAMAVSGISAGQADLAMALEKEAQSYLERNLITALETDRHTLYANALSSASPDSFGFYKARLALDLPDGLRLSDPEVGRLLNRAEETLILRGKWPGTVDEIKLTMPNDGNIYLPFNVETILSAASAEGLPIPVYGRSYDYHENGPGYSTSENNNQDTALIDRGETFSEGKRVRVYFVRGNLGDEKCIRILYKRKAIPHTADSEKMYILNYPALFEMALSFQAQALAPDKAKYHEENALRLLRAELEENKGPNRYNLKVQAKAFSLHDIPTLV